LLARYGGIRIAKEDFEKIPVYLSAGAIPIIVGTPPYHYWEHIPLKGKIPPHGTDTGTFLMAEAFGARRCIFVKDVDGLYIPSPENGKLVKRISVDELLRMDLEDYPVERTLLEIMLYARNIKEIYLINGLKKGNLKKALKGINVGTVIYKK
jgi:molybdenum storage protein